MATEKKADDSGGYPYHYEPGMSGYDMLHSVQKVDKQPAEPDPYETYTNNMLALAQQQLGFSNDLSKKQLKLSERQVEIAEKQQAMAEEQYQYWKDTFQPLEKEFVAESKLGLDPEYYAARAGADVGAAFDKSRGIQVRNMERSGIDASSPRFQALDQDLMIARSAAEAGARNQARNVVADVNYQRKGNAAALGRNIPMQAASISGTAASTYGAAAGTVRGAAETGMAGYGAAMNANQFASNQALNVQQWRADMDFKEKQLKAQREAAMWQGIGSLVGSGIGAFAGFK